MRLIDADALMNSLEQPFNHFFWRFVPPEEVQQAADYARFVKAITAAPTIDAEPVRHGLWMWEGRFKACSLCGSYIDKDNTLGANHWKFCPYCGAKMKEDICK